ncbi:hypothetical protein KY340_03895 [Candidatus Woesearchaeota archaeon]|nr:hypothetical protein [Candidatus Woesearchaeota archaeon]
MAVKHSLKRVSKETVVSIFREYLSKGHDIGFVERALLKAECPKRIIKEAKKELKIGLKQKKQPKIAQKPKFIPKKQAPIFKPKPIIMATKTQPRVITPPKLPKIRAPQGKYLHPLIIILACVAVVIILLMLLSFGTKNCGSNEACMIEKANACEPARFKNMVDTTELSYLIGDDCSITKQITRLGEKEPKEVKDLFLGLSMKCTYNRGAFSRTYLTDISGNLETCEGPLAAVITELRR